MLIFPNLSLKLMSICILKIYIEVLSTVRRLSSWVLWKIIFYSVGSRGWTTVIKLITTFKSTLNKIESLRHLIVILLSLWCHFPTILPRRTISAPPSQYEKFARFTRFVSGTSTNASRNLTNVRIKLVLKAEQALMDQSSTVSLLHAVQQNGKV